MRSFSNFSLIKSIGLVDTVHPKGSRATVMRPLPVPADMVTPSAYGITPNEERHGKKGILP